MRAFVVTDHDSPPALIDQPAKAPASGEIRLQIAACGLNFADLLMAKGTYQDTPATPFVLGLEVAGVIDAIGPDVAGFSIGDRVAVFGGQGGLAEIGCFPADRAVKLPDSMGWVDAAAFQIAYGTSHLALITGPGCNRAKHCLCWAQRGVWASRPSRSANSWARGSSPAPEDQTNSPPPGTRAQTSSSTRKPRTSAPR